MDNAGRLRGFVSFIICPGPDFLGTGGKECFQIQKGIGAFYQPDYSRFLKSDLFQEHLPFFIAFQFGDFRFDFCGDDQNLGILFLHRLANLFYIGIPVLCAVLIYITYVHHRLIGKQEKFFG